VTNSHCAFFAERLGDIDVEAREGAVWLDEVEWRIGAFGADLELEWLFCICNTGSHATDRNCQRSNRCRGGDTLQYAHFQSSRFVLAGSLIISSGSAA